MSRIAAIAADVVFCDSLFYLIEPLNSSPAASPHLNLFLVMALTHNALSSPPHIDPSTTPDDDGADNFN